MNLAMDSTSMESKSGKLLAKGAPQWTPLECHLRQTEMVGVSLLAALPALTHVARAKHFDLLLGHATRLHDIGKATPGFQQALYTGKPYNFRHELLSAAAALVLIEGADATTVATAILGHHRQFDDLQDKWKSQAKVRQKGGQLALLNLIPPPDFEGEWKIMAKSGIVETLQHFGYSANLPSILHDPGHDLIEPWMSDNPPNSEQDAFWTHLCLSGALQICDHNASAGIAQVPVLQPSKLETALHETVPTPFDHQEACWSSSHNVLLVAPTGSGKTEAALGWAASRLREQQGRIFYTLPNGASLNAMYERLTKLLPDENTVGILHGRVSQYLYEHFEHDEDGHNEEGSESKARSQTNLFRKVYVPLKVTTPYQLLKWGFGVKGFERGLTEMAGSCIIVDEVHAYEPDVFQRLCAFLKWVQEHLDVRLFICTATLPACLVRELHRVLPDLEDIQVDEVRLRSNKRHRIELHNGGLHDHIDEIREASQRGKKVLVVCNTVGSAQETFRELAVDDAVLLHARFMGKDRATLEKQIISPASGRQPSILVGTQVIEVSLDIDYDVLYTEPAPMDALVQRMGRVNRKGKREPAPIHIFTEQGPDDHYVYGGDIVERTLTAIAPYSIISDYDAQQLVDVVYPEFVPNEEVRVGFSRVLNELWPYRDHGLTEEQFDEMVHGYEVVPVEALSAYQRLIDEKRYIEASLLLCPLSNSHYYTLRNVGLVKLEAGRDGRRVCVAMTQYDQNLGLTDIPVSAGIL